MIWARRRWTRLVFLFVGSLAWCTHQEEMISFSLALSLSVSRLVSFTIGTLMPIKRTSFDFLPFPSSVGRWMKAKRTIVQVGSREGYFNWFSSSNFAVLLLSNSWLVYFRRDSKREDIIILTDQFSRSLSLCVVRVVWEIDICPLKVSLSLFTHASLVGFLCQTE